MTRHKWCSVLSHRRPTRPDDGRHPYPRSLCFLFATLTSQLVSLLRHHNASGLLHTARRRRSSPGEAPGSAVLHAGGSGEVSTTWNACSQLMRPQLGPAVRANVAAAGGGGGAAKRKAQHLCPFQNLIDLVWACGLQAKCAPQAARTALGRCTVSKAACRRCRCHSRPGVAEPRRKLWNDPLLCLLTLLPAPHRSAAP